MILGSQNNMSLSGSDFERLGQDLAGYRSSSSYATKRRRFVSFFGIEACLVAVVWSFLTGIIQAVKELKSPNPIHLLWALLFVQCYDTEARNAALCKVDEKTYRKWCWFYLEATADLDVELVSSHMDARFQNTK